jgi:hypothetical protein
MKLITMLLTATKWLLEYSRGVFRCVMFGVAICMAHSLDEQGALNHNVATTPVDVWIATGMLCLLVWCSLHDKGN